MLAFHIVALGIALEAAPLRSVETGVANDVSEHQDEVLLEPDRIQDRFLPAGLPIYMKQLLWCTDLCERGPTVEDENDALGKSTVPRSQQVWSEDQQSLIMEKCMWRCRVSKKSKEELGDVPPIDSYSELPARLQEYHQAVAKCVTAGTRTLNETISALSLCGVAHLDSGLFNVELLQQVLLAYKALTQNSTQTLDRVDRRHLRAGREEFWPPFEWPFNASSLLRPSWLTSLMREYLGTDAMLDHMTVLVAPATKSPQAQDMHQDTGQLRRYVEIHVPLADITKAMGPTRFCPGSHGMMQCSNAIKWYFLYCNCSEEPSLSYALPLHSGQVTLYDGTVFHGGTANSAGVDRPVLQLSWAADKDSVEERNYAKRAFAGDKFRQDRLALDIDAFRDAAIFHDGDFPSEDALDPAWKEL